MINRVHSGLDRLIAEPAWLDALPGGAAYLCHAASVDCHLRHGIDLLRDRLGERLVAVFSPQHGLYGEAQDDMIESHHFVHPRYGIPVYSLYSETRRPDDRMLEGVGVLLADLQDIGSRPYTYLSTLIHCMEACAERGIEVWVLDRPNPLGGLLVEGNVLEDDFRSFVGMLPLPMRHGCTIGELALLARTLRCPGCRLRIVPMAGWERSMYFSGTGLPWVLPSPNMPTPDTALVFPGSVLLEGTNLSEGRGTTRPFEILGHPALAPGDFLPRLAGSSGGRELPGCALRPLYFEPVFQKWCGHPCGGLQVHVTDRDAFRPWLTGQWLLRALYRELGDGFAWKEPPFEYDYERLPIDLLNGSDLLRGWVERQGSREELLELGQLGHGEYLARREEVLLYR